MENITERLSRATVMNTTLEIDISVEPLRINCHVSYNFHDHEHFIRHL